MNLVQCCYSPDGFDLKHSFMLILLSHILRFLSYDLIFRDTYNIHKNFEILSRNIRGCDM